MSLIFNNLEAKRKTTRLEDKDLLFHLHDYP
jgi:hypothetical protein